MTTDLMLPAEVIERLPAAAVDRFSDLACRLGEARRSVGRLQRELEAAKVHDGQEERKAAASGERLPPATADQVEQRLAEAKRTTSALARAVAESRSGLYDLVDDDLLREVAAATRAVEQAACERAVALLGGLEQAIAAANAAQDTRLWCAKSAERNAPVAPFSARAVYDLPSGPMLRDEVERRLEAATRAQPSGSEPEEGFRLPDLAAARMSG